MRKYEAPTVTQIGSVEELTLGDISVSVTGDNETGGGGGGGGGGNS